jgi:large subunit ribosomal protein L3
MKRWHWAGGPGTHGHTTHRKVGSIGSTTSPGRVFRGHHMPGHMGDDRVTVQNLKVVKVDVNNNLLLVEGSVPGHKNSYLIIKKALKKAK